MSKPKVKETQASRQNTRMVAGHVHEDVYRAFRLVAVEVDLTTEGAITQAIARWLDSYKKPYPLELKKKLKALNIS